MKKMAIRIFRTLFYLTLFAAVFWLALPKTRLCHAAFDQLHKRYGIAICGRVKPALYGCKMHNGTVELAGAPLAKFSKITISPRRIYIRGIQWQGETARLLPNPIDQVTFSTLHGVIRAAGPWGKAIGRLDIRHRKIHWSLRPTRSGATKLRQLLRNMKREKNGYAYTLAF